METLYQVKGELCQGFVGQISYTISLEREYEELDIGFTFSGQHFTPETLTDETREYWISFCEKEYGTTFSPEASNRLFYNDMKTEIQTVAYLNNRFIGGIHRQLTDRHMHFNAYTATEGCIPQESIKGVLKVTIIVFNVLLDDTPYTLTVKAH